MDAVGREPGRVDDRLRVRRRQRLPMRLVALPERGNEADAGDDDVARAHAPVGDPEVALAATSSSILAQRFFIRKYSSVETLPSLTF